MKQKHTLISSISIAHFRGINEERIELNHSTAIIGENGSGKTHILESIHLASGGHLHYFHAPSDDAYQLGLGVETKLGTKYYRVSRIRGREEYYIQGSKVSGVKYRDDLPYRTVLLSPFDMNLLYFAPAARRDYLDSILSRSFTQFPKIKREYETIMRQRNALLKKIREGEAKREDLSYWDSSFSEKAHLYSLYRKKFALFVSENQLLIQEFLPKYSLKFRYNSKIPEGTPDEFIRSYLRENRERDILSGHTHIGPHLDDFGFEVLFHENTGMESESYHEATGEEVSAALVLSRGETKVLLLALKQIEILFLKKSLDTSVVLLFDDIFAELDYRHAERVIEKFDVDQVIVTTQRPLPVGEKWEDFSCIKLKVQ